MNRPDPALGSGLASGLESGPESGLESGPRARREARHLSVEDKERVELELLLEALYQAWGYDFRHYARASIERRARNFLIGRPETRFLDLLPALLDHPDMAQDLMRHFSVSVTEMFRDPWVYKRIRQQVFPLLRSYPSLQVWHAGCSSGEEAYSTAILLKEAGLLERTQIYATDINDELLEQGRKGIYPVKGFQEATRHYLDAGGQGAFYDYYHARYESAVLRRELRQRISFTNHNLVTDRVFGEMHMVVCRNVLIYFDDQLRDRALTLFSESLVRGGFLCLGAQEDLSFSSVYRDFEVVDARARLYRKRHHD